MAIRRIPRISKIKRVSSKHHSRSHHGHSKKSSNPKWKFSGKVPKD